MPPTRLPVQLGGDPGADAEHTPEISCPIWYVNASECSKKQLEDGVEKKMDVKATVLSPLQLAPGPGSMAENGLVDKGNLGTT